VTVRSECETTTSGLEPSPVLCSPNWLDRQLAPTLAAMRQRVNSHATRATSAVVATTGIGTFASAVLAAEAGGNWLTTSLGAAALATTVSVLAAALFRSSLRPPHDWLFQATTAAARSNIQLLAVFGKLIELRDPETAGHNVRVTLYALMFAEALELSPETVVRTVKGALLHDIGKLVVPDRVLDKPGPLTASERAEMQAHVQHGMDLIAQAEALNDAAPVVAAHQEHYDGSGYPFGLQGEDIPYEARIVALIDVFDALTSPRVYRSALPVADALAIMAIESGTHFDPALLDRFVLLAPAFANQLPRDEVSLVGMLKQRLSPYVDHFTCVEPASAAAPAKK
jgi:putative nucleotidyltransferase with HDIG domain